MSSQCRGRPSPRGRHPASSRAVRQRLTSAAVFSSHHHRPRARPISLASLLVRFDEIIYTYTVLYTSHISDRRLLVGSVCDAYTAYRILLQGTPHCTVIRRFTLRTMLLYCKPHLVHHPNSFSSKLILRDTATSASHHPLPYAQDHKVFTTACSSSKYRTR